MMNAAQPPQHPLLSEATSNAISAAKGNIEALYKPMKPWQTRIVTILPAHSREQLRCNLWTADLIDQPGVAVSGTSKIVPYNALSYSWGPSAPKVRITCNNVTVLANKPVAQAFLYLRKEHERVHVWCDSLCINQSDPVEKAQQVGNMLRIFEKAELVVAWIGPPSHWTGPLFHALKTDCSCGNRKVPFGVPQARFCPQKAMLYRRQHTSKCLKNISEVIKVANEHLKRPWFRRTWVRQEVFGAKNLTIYCGNHTTNLADFVKGISQLRAFERSVYELGQTSLLVPDSVSVLENIYQHAGTDRHEYEPPRQRLRYSAHWLRVLKEGAEFEVTDYRDKVYGVLGIITSPSTRLYVESRPDIQRAEFPISYSKSVSEVYQDVIKHLINLDRNLDVLQIFEDRRNRAKDLPSWVTDWRQKTKRSVIQCAPDDESQRKCIGQAPIQDLNDLGKLRLTGVKIGRPLEQVTAGTEGKKEAEIYLRATINRMDSNYKGIIMSDCIVSGICRCGQNLPTKHSKTSTKSTDFERLHILVPRAARLDDIVVAFLGSSCIFLLRPLHQDEHKFLGPVISSRVKLPEWDKVKTQNFILV